MSETSPVDTDLLHDERVTAFGMLVEAHAHLQRLFDTSLEQRCGIPLAWFEVLLRVARSPQQQLMMSTLAAQVALTSGGTTRLVDRMERGGYVERRPCATDRRVSHVGLTEAGRSKLQEALQVHVRDLQRHLVRPLGAEGMAQAAALLDRLRAHPDHPAR